MRDEFHGFTQRGAALLVVSSTDLEMTSYVAEALNAPYPVLSDPEWSVFHRYGMGSAMGVPLPGTFVIDRAGIIRYAWHAPLSVAFTPPSPNKLFEVLDGL
ncbi:MAG: peroxiredoxin family protein [Chloroflexaceae bacterium]|nr:peroxiredoxin family protein [Chloroflexaceae bacterium]